MYPPLTDDVLALAQSKYERHLAKSVIAWSKASSKSIWWMEIRFALSVLGFAYFVYQFKRFEYALPVSLFGFFVPSHLQQFALTRRMQGAPGAAPLQQFLVWAKRFTIPFALPIALWVIGGGLFVLGSGLGLLTKNPGYGPLYVMLGGSTLASVGVLVNELRVAVTLLRRFEARLPAP